MSGDDRRQRAEPVDEERRRGDRRRWRRVPVQVWAESMEGSSSYYNLTVDISEGGAFLATPAPFPVGTEISLRLELPAGPGAPPDEVTLRGVVFEPRDADQPGMGVGFKDVSDDVRARIRKLTER